MRIKEVIVVEGKDDTYNLKKYFDVDTIETNGSDVTEELLNRLQILNNQRGIIVFTDPDRSGEEIRTTIMQRIPTAKHAFITKKEGTPKKKGSLGVEHASYEALVEALNNVVTANEESDKLIPIALLTKYGLIAGPCSKQLRSILGEELKIGYTNGKQLQKRLAMFNITEEQLIEAMEKILKEL